MKKFILIIFLACSCGNSSEPTIFGISRNEYVLGQDGVTPIELSDSITMWTFGDTLVETSEMISNSLSFTEKLSPANISKLKFKFLLKNDKVCQFINYNKNENPLITRLWPVDGIRIADKVYVYYFIIKITDAGNPFGFTKTAVGIAMWSIPDNWNIESGVYSVNFKRLPNLFPENYPAFGAAVFMKDNYIYTAGQFTDRNKSSINISRVHPENIANGNTYEFLCANGSWTRDIKKTYAFFNDVMGECSLSYNGYLGKYIITYCQQWTGKIIIVSFADFANLSKAEKTVMYEPPAITKKTSDVPLYYYSAKEILSSEKFIYAIYMNPAKYQPYLIKINISGL